MGVCLTWFAIRGKDPETVCAELGMDRTGQRAADPWPRISGVELPDGWYLVQRPKYECRDDGVPAQLSLGGELLSLFVEEHVMVARICCWKDGKRVWSVLHSSEKGDHHLEADGDLPPEFLSIRDAFTKKKGETSYFEIPCSLAASLTGYQYDGPLQERPLFEVLALPPWWERLLATYPGLFWS